MSELQVGQRVKSHKGWLGTVVAVERPGYVTVQWDKTPDAPTVGVATVFIKAV